MNRLKTIVELLKSETLNAWSIIKAFSKKGWGYVCEALSFIWSKIKCASNAVYDYVVGMSLTSKVFISLSLFLCLFLFWQFMTFSVSQPVFVMVNLLLVIVSSAFTCYVIFSANTTIASLKKEIEELDQVRKDKDQEIRSLKSEIHDLNIASRKQQSFGKNSQVLIDTIKKNRKEASAYENRGLFILKSLAQCSDICCGIIYMKRDGEDVFDYAGGYALPDIAIDEETLTREVTKDDAIIGQVISSGQMMKISNVPSENLTITSGLGESKPINIYILPIKYKGEVVAVTEVSSFSKLAIADIWKDIDNVLLDD